ncbi:glycoside hydrolase [Echinicola sediminis]
MMRFACIICGCLGLILTGCDDGKSNPNDPQFRPNPPSKGLIIDLSTAHQTMHHFGASDGWSAEIIGKNWADEDKEFIAKHLFSKEFDESGKPVGIGLSMWRSNVGAGSANQTNNGFSDNSWHKATECALTSDGAYDWENNQIGSRWFMERAKSYGVEYLTAWVTSPPYFMTKNGYTFRTEDVVGYNLPQERYDEFADYLNEYLNYHRSKGIDLDYISLINEPQWEWKSSPGDAAQEGSYCTNQEAFELTKVVNELFQKEGQLTKILLPEAGDLPVMHSFVSKHAQTSNQLDVFWNPNSGQFLGQMNSVAPLVAGHSYWSNGSVKSAIENRISLNKRLQSFGVDFWQTEYSLLGTAYREGRDPSQMLAIDYMLWLARIIHWDISLANATGWSFWTACSASKYGDHENRFGLLTWQSDVQNRNSSAGTIEVSRLLWSLGHFSRFIRPGYKRVEVINTLYDSEIKAASNLMASGFLSQDKKKLVLVIINYGEKLEEPVIENYGESIAFENDQVQIYTSNYQSDMVPKTIKISDLQIPAKSIVTLTAELE